MKTFKIENGDLVFDNLGNFEIVEGIDEIAQSIERILTTNIGEWFLNIDFGLNYNEIKGKGIDKQGIELALRDAIFQDERVDEVEFEKINIDNKNRSLEVIFNIKTIDGEREEIEVII